MYDSFLKNYNALMAFINRKINDGETDARCIVVQTYCMRTLVDYPSLKKKLTKVKTMLDEITNK